MKMRYKIEENMHISKCFFIALFVFIFFIILSFGLFVVSCCAKWDESEKAGAAATKTFNSQINMPYTTEYRPTGDDESSEKILPPRETEQIESVIMTDSPRIEENSERVEDFISINDGANLEFSLPSESVAKGEALKTAGSSLTGEKPEQVEGSGSIGDEAALSNSLSSNEGTQKEAFEPENGTNGEEKSKVNASLFYTKLKNYTDVILSVITSISIALASITATIFIFSKSALDRINDENEYVSDIVNTHKSNNIKLLVWICVGSIALVVLPIMWHARFTFSGNPDCFDWIIRLGLISLGIALVCYVIMTIVFWNRCIRVEESLKKIIADEFKRLKEVLNKLLPQAEEKNRLILIGDWASWEDEDKEEYKKIAQNLCKKMSRDQFINQFLKAEKLLLSGENNQTVAPISNVITILQERINISEPNFRVEKEDLETRTYLGSPNSSNVIDNIKYFQKQLMIIDSDDKIQLSFFGETENLYSVLKEYRNLLISERYTQVKTNEQGKKEDDDNRELYLFTQAYYYFYLRILAIFSSSVRITNFSLNGSSLNYANFYSSTLEDITFYSAEFYRTIFARVKFVRVIMDISRLYDVDFYCIKFLNSSLNNAAMEFVQFDHAFIQEGGFDSCEITSCSLSDSDFINCTFNNSVFKNTTLRTSNFSNSKLREIVWDGGSIDGCSFQSSELHKWSVRKPLKMINCDFSQSSWSDMKLIGCEIPGGTFNYADLSGIKLEKTAMDSASFLQCRLDEAEIKECRMTRSNFQVASLFNAYLCEVDMSSSDLSNVLAVKTDFINCSFAESNCADADFSEAKFNHSNLYASRLYNCAMTRSVITDCDGQYLLADHLQFTFATCKNSDFSHGALSESNLTKSTFSSCIFTGSDLSSINATETCFIDCVLERVDFSGSRFVETTFSGTNNKKKMIIKNCIFSSCKFERVSFEHVKFLNCLFDNAIFSGCKNGVLSQPLTKRDFKGMSDRYDSTITWL